MRSRAHVFPAVGALVALQALLPAASLAIGGGDPEEPARQAGEDRWIPSLAITAGATIQQQQGFAESLLFEEGSPDPVPLRPADSPNPLDGDDIAVSPFVGGSLELMTPALPIPMRPRVFLSGEILPTFAPSRDVALEHDPSDCVRGPEVGQVCAKDEDGSRRNGFGEDAAVGVGTRTSAEIGTLVYGAILGVAFPVQLGMRQLRIKPSVGWISYEVDATGIVVDATCDPANRCTDVTPILGQPPLPGFLREVRLAASSSQRFHGIGPGVDVEMDTGRFGPLGVSLFLGGLAYRVLGDRTIAFGATESYPASPNGLLVPADGVAAFEVEVEPWMFRAHLGIRFNWLGSRK